MATNFFGQFLLEKGVITREMLLDGIRYQKSIHQPLCALALEKGYLNAETMQQLDDEHQNSDKKFLEIALKNEVLTFKQLEDLAKEQSERWMFLGEALVEKGHIRLAQLNDLFEQYRQQQEPDDSEIESVLVDMPEKELVSSLLQLTVDLFLHYTKQIVKVTSVEASPDGTIDVAYIFSQAVKGDKNFDYALALPEELTLAIASYILQEEVTEISDMVLDAVAEFVNVVVGNGCAKLSIRDFKVMAEAPRVMNNELISSSLPPASLVVNMQTVKGDFKILFFFEGK